MRSKRRQQRHLTQQQKPKQQQQQQQQQKQQDQNQKEESHEEESKSSFSKSNDNEYFIPLEGISKSSLSIKISDEEKNETIGQQSQRPQHTKNHKLIRDTRNLYASKSTVNCALGKGGLRCDPCISCAYKIGCFDVMLDTHFQRTVPNVRPELCPRSLLLSTKNNNNNNNSHSENFPLSIGYHPGMSVLTLGDGDFTFSLAIARMILSPHNNSSSAAAAAGKIVATSYESKHVLETIYPKLNETLDELSSFGNSVMVLFEVDATRLDSSLLSSFPPSSSATASAADDDNNKKKREEEEDDDDNNKQWEDSKTVQFDRIVWNFPCRAMPLGQDGQNEDMDQNKELIGTFVRNVLFGQQKQKKGYLRWPNGEIHMTHKTKPPFDQWQIETVVSEAGQQQQEDKEEEQQEQIVQDEQCDSLPISTSSKEDEALTTKRTTKTSSSKIEYRGRIVFDRCCLPPYIPRKALDKKSFSSHDACIYVFGYNTSMDSKSCLLSHDKQQQQQQQQPSLFFSPTIPSSTTIQNDTNLDENTSMSILERQDNNNNNDDDGDKSIPQADHNDKDNLVLVTEDMIHQIRSLHLDVAEVGRYSNSKKKKKKKYGKGQNSLDVASSSALSKRKKQNQDKKRKRQRR